MLPKITFEIYTIGQSFADEIIEVAKMTLERMKFQKCRTNSLCEEHHAIFLVGVKHS